MEVIFQKTCDENSDIVKVDGTLKSYQELVEGYIEPVYNVVPGRSDIVLIVNEDGISLEKDFNGAFGNRMIFGNYVVLKTCVNDDGSADFCGFDDKNELLAIKNYIDTIRQASFINAFDPLSVI